MANDTIPVGADEYATTLMTCSWKALPWAGPAARGIVELPAPQIAANKIRNSFRRPDSAAKLVAESVCGAIELMVICGGIEIIRARRARIDLRA